MLSLNVVAGPSIDNFKTYTKCINGYEWLIMYWGSYQEKFKMSQVFIKSNNKSVPKACAYTVVRKVK